MQFYTRVGCEGTGPDSNRPPDRVRPHLNDMSMPDRAEIVESIYEAAFVPETWHRVMQDISDVSNCAAGGIGLIDDSVTCKFLATDLIQPVLNDIEVTGDWNHTNILGMLFRLPPPAAFIYDEDFFPPEVLAANRVRVDRVRPLGIGGEVGTYIVMPTGEVVLFCMERWLSNDRPSQDELDVLNAFRPHLARAGLIAARLRLERAHAATATLRALGLPAAVLSVGGRVLATNSLLEDLPHIFRPAAFGALSIAHGPADALLRDALEAQRAGNTEPVRSIPIPGQTPDEAPYVVHLLPLRGSAQDVFSHGDMVLAATRVDAAGGQFPPATLIGLFDLSPAEAKLAVQLAEGLTVIEASQRSGITTKTGRTYLERLFAKTGTRRQAELIALLRSTAVMAPN